MSKQILGNLFLAVIWMCLTNLYTFGNFALGFLFGLLVIFLLYRKNGRRFYLFKLFLGVRLLLIFFKEIIWSNFTVLKLLFFKKNIRPAIVRYETRLTDPLAVTILANMITLTPGTVTMEISPDRRQLFIHALVVDDIETFCDTIRVKFEENIAEVMR